MSKPILNRATEIADFTGRTLEGVAYRYDYPSRVTDDGWQTSYFEEVLRGCDRRTLLHRSVFPLTKLHSSHGGHQVGAVTFARSDDERALMFTATVDHGRPGDELIAALDEWSDVSVTFAALRNSARETPHHGRIVQRAEIRLEELALTPSGTGLAKGAEVLALRSTAPVTPSTPAPATRLAEYRARALQL